jgi:hypothetical protein
VAVLGAARPANAGVSTRTVSVTRAIRHALARIRTNAPRLGAHLDHAIRTGTYCAYRPDPAANGRWDA